MNRTKDEIKNAPEYDEEKHRGDTAYRERYRENLGNYYGPGGAGYRDDGSLSHASGVARRHKRV